MHRLNLIHKRSLAALVVVVAACSLAGIAHGGPAPPPVPDEIAVPEGHKLFLVAHAVGYQTYRCDEGPNGFEWSFAGPYAVLYTKGGKFLGTHFGGPTWMASDGSYVQAQRVAGVTVDASAIAWLRLERTTAVAGPDGDRFTGVTFIQRIATTGGLPPATPTCDATRKGDTKHVDYTADYTFWKATGA